MIEEIYIKDFALIQELRISFSQGLNIITGETGAGKSIMLGALNLLLGSRATTDMIKTGAARSIVEASFRLKNNPELISLLQEKGVFEEDTLILKRELTAEGKGRSFINSHQVPVSMLKEVGRFLVDIHGQNENQNILNKDNHRTILDRFAQITDKVGEYKKQFHKRNELQQKLKSVSLDEQEKNRRLEVLKHEISEIESASLKNDRELEELESREKILDNAESLIKNLSGMYQKFQSDSGGILSDLSFMERTLEKDNEYDDSLMDIISPVRESYYLLSDVAATMRDKADSIMVSPDEVQIVKERIDLINDLLRKYGPTVEDAIAYLERAKNEHSGIELSSEEESKLRKQIQDLSHSLVEQAKSISSVRKEYAGKLEELVSAQIHDLGMGDTKVRISIKWEYGADGEVPSEDGTKKYILLPNGLDMVEFYLASGPQETLRPLKKIASGGEMSRIMLALKKIITDSDPVNTMVFDEVDTGVGGGVAESVGRKIAEISNGAQVMVITHLHQVAGCSGENVRHFLVSKDSTFGTKIVQLTHDQRIDELARMIGGQKITESALLHARSLLAN